MLLESMLKRFQTDKNDSMSNKNDGLEQGVKLNFAKQSGALITS